MVKRSILLAALVLSVGCREEVETWDSLTTDEQNEILNRAKANCLAGSTAGYNNFKDSSDNMFASTTYNRGLGFLHEYKNTGFVSSTELRVWKQDPNGNLYFFVTDTAINATKTSYFLRVTRVQNEEILDQMKIDQCAKFYTSATIGDSGPLTITLDYSTPISTGSTNYVDTYTLSFDKLAFMAAYQFSRKVQDKNTAGAFVGSAQTFTSTWTPKTDTPPFATNDYTNSTHYTQLYCEIDYKSGDTVFRLHRDIVGFANRSCTSSAPADWDMTIL